MKYEYHTIIIGGGSAGLTVASGCATFGAKVALIEKGKMGGDCLNSGCVPSKAFLHLACNIAPERVDIKVIMERVRSVQTAIAPHDSKERFEGMGINVINGEAQLLDSHSVQVGGKTITSKHIVLATGSKPMIPPISGLKDIQYLTNENIFAIEALPKHLVVLGGGPVGLELGQAFRRLGSEVSIIDAQPALLPNDDVEAGRLLEKRFADEGINLYLGSKIIEVKAGTCGTEVIIKKGDVVQEVIGDKMLVALGRAPVNIAGLEVAGVKTNKRGYIITDRYLRTGIKNIFACGDCAGPYQFTHTAGHQGSIVVRNLIFPFKARVDYSAVPWVTYTKPEVAHTGLTEQGAVAKGIFKKAITVALGDIDRSIIEGEAGGFLKMIIGNNNRVIGITIVAQKAGEMIASGILAVAKKMRPSVFASVIFPYPTQSEIYKTASYLSLKDAFKPWMRKLVNLVSLR